MRFWIVFLVILTGCSMIGVVVNDPIMVSNDLSILDNNTIVGVYGRVFNVAPDDNIGLRNRIALLGSLGYYKNFEDFWNGVTISGAADVKPIQDLVEVFDNLNGDKGVIPAIDIIAFLPYCEMREDGPVWKNGDISYILRKYANSTLIESVIKPAADKGVLVFVDHQLGGWSVNESMQEIIDAGYLEYDNVHIAFDPEWHVDGGQCNGGGYIGSIEAEDVNDALKTLSRYIDREVIVLLYHFTDIKHNFNDVYMIKNKDQIKSPDPLIKVVFVADGVGGQCAKTKKYKSISNYRNGYSGIKYFPYNSFSGKGDDEPVLTEAQLLGVDPVPCQYAIKNIPSVIIRN